MAILRVAATGYHHSDLTTDPKKGQGRASTKLNSKLHVNTELGHKARNVSTNLVLAILASIFGSSLTYTKSCLVKNANSWRVFIIDIKKHSAQYVVNIRA